MPERSKAVAALVGRMEGGVSFNAIEDVAYVGAVGDKRRMTMGHYLRVYDEAWVASMEAVDWNRVFLQASARHDWLGHEDGDYGAVCEECLLEALLIPGDWHDWSREPTAPRRRR